jgi:Flp pilus assembly protein TadD
MAWNSDFATNAMSALSSQITQRETLAYSALNRGLTAMQNGEYAQAIREFQVAAAYKPDLAETQICMGRTYELMDKTEEAIKAYKQASRIDPSNADAVELLASLYMTNERYPEAQEQLKQLIRLDPTDASAVASLGYAYLNDGEIGQAEQQFMQAVRLAPRDASSYFNLGLAYSREGRFTDAIREFQTAINLDIDYAAAHSELGFAYLGLDEQDLARNELTTLREIGTDESNGFADQLASALYTPKILINDSLKSSFNAHLGAGTALTELDSRLATPGATVTFSMTFMFNQAMDIASVQKVTNWWISRATGGEAGVYNNGASGSPGNETSISPLPKAVRYDPLNLRATVYFTITQNATGTRVIDPSHWVFRFRGLSAQGTEMDHRGDEYDGAAWGSF